MRREKAPDNFSQCRKCGARIIFVRMKSGKSMPVNPNFVNFRRDGGKDRIVLANGEVTSGTIVTDPGEAQGFGYVSHFATCEYAQTFRRKWATALIDTITFGRIRSLEVIPDCVKDAICCAVEKYSTYQKLRNQELKSESNDGYSVSYADAGKESDMRQEVIADMKIYLSGTGLTYRGRSRKYDYKPGHHYF